MSRLFICRWSFCSPRRLPQSRAAEIAPPPHPLPLLLRLYPPSLTKPREPPLPPLRLPPSTFATDSPPLSHPIPSPTPYTLDIVADLLTPLARSSRDDLSKIGKLTIVDRHPFFLLPFLLIFFLLHVTNVRLVSVCSFARFDLRLIPLTMTTVIVSSER